MIPPLIGVVSFLSFLAATGVAYATTWWLTQHAPRAGWLDRPHDERKIHDEATPTAGGIGIACGFFAGMAVLWAGGIGGLALTVPQWAFWAGAVVMLATGIVDDLYGASFKKKFFVQSVVAYGLLLAGYGVDINALVPVAVDPYDAALLTMPLTMLWVVGVMNAVNFIDGLDGLASGTVLIVVLAFAVILGVQGAWGMTLTCVALAGALIGFLRHNAYPASIFMGDSGSLLLGYVAAVFPLSAPLVQTDPIVNVLVPAVALGLPLLDTTVTVTRRLLGNRSVFAPDKDHIHHRMMMQWSEPHAVRGMYAAAGWFGVAAICMSMVPARWAYAIGGVTAVVAIAWVVRLGYVEDNIATLQEKWIMGRRALDQGTPGENGAVPAAASSRDTVSSSASEADPAPDADGAKAPEVQPASTPSR